MSRSARRWRFWNAAISLSAMTAHPCIWRAPWALRRSASSGRPAWSITARSGHTSRSPAPGWPAARASTSWAATPCGPARAAESRRACMRWPSPVSWTPQSARSPARGRRSGRRLLLLRLTGARVSVAAALGDADAGDGAQQRQLRFGARLHVRRRLQLGLSTAPRLLRAGLVDLVDALGRVRQDRDTTLIHLHKAAGHGQEVPCAIAQHAQLAGLERRQQRLVARQDNELTRGARRDDHVHLFGEHR